MRTGKVFGYSLALALILSCQGLYAQLTVTPGNLIHLTPTQFVQTYLVGAGVTISNAKFNGSSDTIRLIQTVGGSIENQQIGSFTAAGKTLSEIVFTGGVIMSSGKVTSAKAPPPDASTAMNGPTGDPDLAKISNVTTAQVLDQAVLEFDFIAQTDIINFRYEFASEEFDQYCGQYNDAFGFFLSGTGISGGMGYVNDAVNIALLPNTLLPVTINNVCANKPLYSWWNVPEVDLAYNRFTHVFTASYSINCLQSYHIKLAISDVVDRIFDSGVLLEMNSFTSNGIQINTTFSNPSGGQNAIRGCSNAILVFSIPEVQATDYVIDLAIDPTGTADQADFLPNPLPSSVTIPAGTTTSPPLVIQTITDPVPAGNETLILDASHTTCGYTSTTTVSILIKEKPPLLVTINQPPPGLICDGAQVTLNATISGGYPSFYYLWSGNLATNPATITASYADPVVTLRVTDVCADTTIANLTLNVTPYPAAPGAITGLSSICKPLSSVAYHVDLIPGVSQYTWLAPPGVTAPVPPSSNDITLDFGAGSASGTVEVHGVNQCGSGPSSVLPVSVFARPVPTISETATNPCLGSTVTYITEAGKTNYSWTYPLANASLVSGGTGFDNTMTLNWSVVGPGVVSVNYNDNHNCSAINPTTINVSVIALPLPTISGTAVICVGSTGLTYTTEAGQNNYTWSVSPGNNITPSGNTCTVDWLVTGSQWVRVVYQDPVTLCTSSTANPGLSVTVNPLPVPSVTGTVSGCQGLSLGPFTTETGKSGYNWNPDGGTIVQGSGPYEVYITWNTAGTKQVTVTYSDANNCQGTSPVHVVTVNATPAVSFNSPATAFCPNNAAFILTYGSPAGGTYTGTGVVNISGTYYFNPSLANVGANALNYSYTSAQGCNALANGSIIVNPLPDVQFTPAHPNQKWCSASPVNVTLGSSVPLSTFAWTASANPATINPSSINNGSGNISQAFQNTGSITEAVQFQVSATASGCTSSPYPYTVQINPVATISASPASQVICSATNTAAIAFSLVPASGTSVNWSYSATAGITPASGSGSSNPVPATSFSTTDPLQGTVTYSVTTTYDNCPGNSLQYTMHVNPVPMITNSPLSQAICLGSSSTQVTFTPTTGYTVSYQWLATPSPASVTGYTAGSQSTAFIPVQTLTDPSNSTGTVTYAITPSITASSVTCSGNPQNYIINTNPLPTPNIQTVQPVCEQTSGLNYSTADLPNHGYQWSITGGTITSSTNTSSIIVNWGPNGMGSLSVTESITSTNPVCQNTNTKTVTLLPRPLPTITANYNLSNGICLNQTGSYLTEAGMSNYTWTISAGGNITVQNNQNLSVNWVTTGIKNVTVNYNAANGCNALVPATVSFIVNPLPDVTISGPSPAVACQGSSSSFTVPADPNSSFTWAVFPAGTGNLTSTQGQPNATILWLAAANNTSVSTLGLTTHGCTASSQVVLNVHPTPVVTMDACFDPVTIPSAKAFKLHGGVPYGASGVFSGEGVTFTAGQYQFDPASVAGPFPKTVPILYSYTNVYGCASSGSKSIEVVNEPSFACENQMTPLRDVRTTPNKTYNTYWRGNRCWMIQNLDYGTETSTTLAQTDNCQPQKFCPASDPGCTLYGGFYQWDELMQYSSQQGAQGLCPPGWHIPSLSEWQMLIDDPLNEGNALAGGFLKDMPFSPKLEGVFYMNNTWKFLQGDNLTSTLFWTSTLNSSFKAWARGLNNFTPSVSLYSSSRLNAFPVRCVKD